MPAHQSAGQRGKAIAECLLSKEGPSDVSSVASAHTAILDQIVELDENLMEKYLGGEEPNYEACTRPSSRR